MKSLGVDGINYSRVMVYSIRCAEYLVPVGAVRVPVLLATERKPALWRDQSCTEGIISLFYIPLFGGKERKS